MKAFTAPPSAKLLPKGASPPIRPPASISSNFLLADCTIPSSLPTPKNLTALAGKMNSPSDTLIGISSRTSWGSAPGGTSLPLIGSIIPPSA